MNLLQRTVSINDLPLHFVHPENDDTIYGTLSCLSNDRFRLSSVTFSPGDVFVDLGSNVGLLSLVVARMHPKTRVYAFDASPTAIACVRRSAALNQMDNVQAFQVAIGPESEKNVPFYSNGKEVSCLIEGGLNSASNSVPECTVNKVSIEEVFDSALLGIDRVRYLKCDIEGGEFAVFERLFGQRMDILDRIDYLHLEIHGYEQYDPAGLKARVQERFGERVFFDT